MVAIDKKKMPLLEAFNPEVHGGADEDKDGGCSYLNE